MTPRPLSFLRIALLLPLLYFTPARAQYTLMENHPGFWVEWLQQTDSTIIGVTLGDADNDGAPDLFVVDGSSLELWRNNGRGEFELDPGLVVPLPLGSVLALDADGDTRVDLVGAVAGSSGGLAFLKGLGGGRFAAPVISATGTNYGKLVEMDINGDGIPEVVAVADPGTGLHVLEWDGKALTVTAHLIPSASVIDICVADLNADGRQDLVAGITGDPWGSLVIFMSDGQALEGIVAVPNPREFYSIIPVDFDGDGDLDLLTDSYSSVILLRGNGTGRDWEWVGIPGDFGGNPLSMQVADLNRNGDPELLIAWGSGYRGVFLEAFHPRTDPTLSSGRRISYAHTTGVQVAPNRMMVADLNRDDRPDLLLVSPSRPYPRISGPGMFGVLLNHNGILGGVHLAPADVPSYSIAAARFHPSRPPEILLAGPAGLFLASPPGDGTLAPSRRIGDGATIRVADLNHDGRDDLIVGVGGTTEVRLTRPNGPGQAVARFEGRVIDVGDLDHDRWPDLLVRRTNGELDIVWDDPHHRFDRVSHTGINLPRSFLAIVGDADGDGRNELIECRLHPRNHYRDPDGRPDTISAYRCSPVILCASSIAA